jgi:hypothetical protein
MIVNDSAIFISCYFKDKCLLKNQVTGENFGKFKFYQSL